MPIPIRTAKDLEGKFLVVEGGFRALDGRYYLLLRRLPPLYERNPVFLVRLSGDKITKRLPDGDHTCYKAYAIQDLIERERQFLMSLDEGKDHLPFFNFSYPNVIRLLGKKFYKLSTPEVSRVMGAHTWALIP